MMRNSTLAITTLICLMLFSCSQDPVVNEVVEVEEIDPNMPELDDFDYDTLRGMYVGDFGGSDIRIIVNYVSQTNAIGYNIHKGLQRNISGKVRRSGDSIIVQMAEPGDHEYDGVFELLFTGIDKEPKGKWVSNSGKIKEKNFSLKKMEATENKFFEEFDEINVANFHNFFGDASDTLGDYSFKSDGLVIFSYYPGGRDHNYDNRGAARTEQLKEIQGTWSLDGKELTIDWAKNTVFPKSQMKYNVRKGEWEAELVGDGGSIWMNMYP